MKKLIFTLLTVLVSNLSFAQVGLGGATGVSLSQASNDYGSDDEIPVPIVSIPISFIAEFKLSKSLSLQTGLTAVRKGLGYRDGTSGDYYKYGYHLSFIEAPVTLKLYLGQKKTKFYLLGGIYTAFLSGGKLKSKIAVNGDVAKETEKMDLEDYDFTNPIDIGIKSGMGLEFSLKSGYLFISPTIHYGLIDIDTDEDFYLKNRALLIQAGYVFTLTKKKAK